MSTEKADSQPTSENQPTANKYRRFSSVSSDAEQSVPAQLVQLTPAELDARARTGAQQMMLALFAGFLLLFGGCYTYHFLNPSPVAKSSDWPLAGDAGTLRMKGAEKVYLTPDLESFKEASKALMANDDFGFRELYSKGKIFFSPNGTKVKYLEGEGWVSGIRVRILSGPLTGESGWTELEAFQPASK